MRSKHEIRFPSARIIHEQRDFDCSKFDVVIVALPSNAIGEILRQGDALQHLIPPSFPAQEALMVLAV